MKSYQVRDMDGNIYFHYNGKESFQDIAHSLYEREKKELDILATLETYFDASYINEHGISIRSEKRIYEERLEDLIGRKTLFRILDEEYGITFE